jgi:hypothetical protein
MMKQITAFPFAASILILCASESFSQTVSTPESRARSFYAWYLHELNAETQSDREFERTWETHYGEIRPRDRTRTEAQDGIDADIFIDAQDFDPLWEKNIATSRAAISGNRATVNVTLKGGPSSGTKRLKSD